MSEIITDKITGKTSAGDVTITSEGGAVTMQLQQGLTKAWLNFQGSGTVTIFDDLNHSSVTDSATGKFIGNLTNAMSNINSSITSTTSGGESLIGNTAAPTTTTYNIDNGNASFGAYQDDARISTHLIGDLA